MQTPEAQGRQPLKMRRWPRHKVDLPVRIVAANGLLTSPVLARGTDVSRAGMALHVAMALTPGELMQLEFSTAKPMQVSAVVRNRSANCLGVEFLTQLATGNEAASGRWTNPNVPTVAQESRKPARLAPDPEALHAGLRRKQQQLLQLRREIEALITIIPLLAD